MNPFEIQPMDLMDLKIAIDKAIEDLGPETKVYTTYTQSGTYLSDAMSVYSEVDEDGIIEDGKPFIVISRHTQDNINECMNDDKPDHHFNKVYFSKN